VDNTLAFDIRINLKNFLDRADPPMYATSGTETVVDIGQWKQMIVMIVD
jgi:hypothetical protein